MDPAAWEKLDELESDLKEVKLYCAIFFLALFAAAAAAAIIYFNIIDIKKDLREARQEIVNLKAEISVKTTGEYITNTQWEYMKSRWKLNE